MFPHHNNWVLHHLPGQSPHIVELGFLLRVTGLLGGLAAGRGAEAVLPDPDLDGELGDPMEN